MANLQMPPPSSYLHSYPSIQGCAKALIDSTAEGDCAHVKTLFDRGASIIEELLTILVDNGHAADEFLPLKTSAPLLSGPWGLMHDTCTTANAAAKRIVEVKNAAGIEFYGAERWAALDPLERETFDVLCFNRTRQSSPSPPTTASPRRCSRSCSPHTRPRCAGCWGLSRASISTASSSFAPSASSSTPSEPSLLLLSWVCLLT